MKNYNQYTIKLQEIKNELAKHPVGDKRSKYLQDVYYPSLKTLARQISEECEELKTFATYLHKEFCTYNHTDGCSWYYEGDDWTQSTHSDWLFKAVDVFNFTTHL